MIESENYYNCMRPDIAKFVPKKIRTILDIGCGTGAFLKLIKEQTGAETWGIEILPEIAEIAKGKADSILVGKIEDLLSEIPNNYFDCITFNDVIEHIHEPIEILRMTRSKLNKNGIIITSIPNVRYFFNLYELLIKKEWEYKGSGILDSTHFRFFTKKSMNRMIDHAGYKLIKQVGINKIISWKFQLFNLLTIGFFKDTKYLQFVCISETK